MGYEILSDDLLDSGNQAPGPQPNGKIKRFLKKINPFHLNILFIIIILGGIGYYLISDFDFDFNFGTNETGIITLSGKFDKFSKEYSGNLTLYSGKFSIETETGKFDGEKQTITLENFSGYINQTNNSLTFIGTANKIKFGRNEINTNDGNLKLTSSGKTQTDLFLENIYFKKLQGNVKLDSTLNYGFESSSINLTNFQTTMTFDGSYTFVGKAETFEISSIENNLKIIYDLNSNKTTQKKETDPETEKNK